MRLDKFLKVSRLIKRRTVANDASSAGRINVNDKPVKPSYKLSVGDIIEINLGATPLRARVEIITEHSTKENAGEMYTIIS